MRNELFNIVIRLSAFTLFINLPFRDKYIRVEIWCDPDGEKCESKGQHVFPDTNEVVRISKRKFSNKNKLRS